MKGGGSEKQARPKGVKKVSVRDIVIFATGAHVFRRRAHRSLSLSES